MTKLTGDTDEYSNEWKRWKLKDSYVWGRQNSNFGYVTKRFDEMVYYAHRTFNDKPVGPWSSLGEAMAAAKMICEK